MIDDPFELAKRFIAEQGASELLKKLSDSVRDDFLFIEKATSGPFNLETAIDIIRRSCSIRGKVFLFEDKAPSMLSHFDGAEPLFFSNSKRIRESAENCTIDVCSVLFDDIRAKIPENAAEAITTIVNAISKIETDLLPNRDGSFIARIQDCAIRRSIPEVSPETLPQTQRTNKRSGI